MPSLTGKTALVTTGASRGMGRASALALAAAGAQVLVHYGRGAKEADGVVAEIRKAGSRADAIATDLAAASSRPRQKVPLLRLIDALDRDEINLVEFTRGGQTIWRNLQILCRPCNLAKQDGSWESFGLTSKRS
jgi:NAD(P)-dependent dehydrogenase (short-subunit alcohol dehydrogenase family)